ncbi:hypothetical protein UA08_07925 [Talaromyces atroroseus]|uniref:PLD phosphodiesterase domain-containing protein n=1 Tax=Talaromyces atroroseus TaxID=1441469 RepID=A0A225A7V7_TALAT|nr:hypothetical protein UA08_07925 [Talaromyces atroroseus]OKL56771.1 hypothetical protein UA08_07925 [Talaromyces atroroseus]
MAHSGHKDPAVGDARADSMEKEDASHLKREDNVVDLTADSDDEQKLTSSNAQTPNVIDLDDEDDDEDFRRAIALSMQEMKAPQDLDDVVSVENSDKKDDAASDKSGHTLSTEAFGLRDDNDKATAPQNAFSILGLDRKKLEEERLARVAKRKAESSISPPPLRRDAKLVKRDVVDIDKLAWSRSPPSQPLSQQTAKEADSAAQAIANVKATPQATTVQPSSVPSLRFPKGVIKKTWAFGCARIGDDIKIEEVLQSSDLQLAILSSFQWDMEWLFSKFRTRDTRFMLVMQAKEESTKYQYEEETADMPNIRLCFPPMDGQVNCMHSKLMLLFHPEYLRIVVPSANLVPYDWGEQGGVMENTVFLIDLPRSSETASTKTAFYDELVYFLKASTLRDGLIEKLTHFDFKETSRYAFVHTIGGSHIGEAWRRTGHCGLGKAVQSLGLRTHEPINIDFVTSSIGSLTDEFMRSIYLSAQGDDGTTEYTLRTFKTFPISTTDDNPIQRNTGAEWKKHFRVYYPSDQTVSKSKGGYRNAGTICFQEKWFDGPKFPRHVLHDSIIFIRPASTDAKITHPDGSSCAGWAYVGSANLSESAWGRIVHDRTRKAPKLNCRNWECGVLVPVDVDLSSSSSSSSSHRLGEVKEDNDENQGKEEEKDILAHVFGATVPVPMRVPAPPLGAELKPWYGAW